MKSKPCRANGFSINPRNGRWSFSAGKSAVRNATTGITINSRIYTLADATSIEYAPAKNSAWEINAIFTVPHCKLTVRFETAPAESVLRITCAIRNLGKTPLVLGDCELIRLDPANGGALQLASPPKPSWRIFAFNGSLNTQRVKELAADNGRHKTAYFLHLCDAETKKTFLAGFTTFDRLYTEFVCHYNVRQRNLACAARCRFEDFALNAGATAASETLAIILADDPHQVLEHWAEMVAAHYKPRIWKQPPVGWVGWAWEDPSVRRPDRQVEAALRTIRQRLRGFGVEYIWISITNIKDGLPGNWLLNDRRNFPQGIRRTLRKIIRAGLKPGFWTGLFYVNEASAAFKENKHNLLREKTTGALLARGRWLWAYRDRDGREHINYALDGSHPRSLKFLKHVYATYRRWGIRYYMMDFLGAGNVTKDVLYHDRRLIAGPAIPRQGLNAARLAAGKDTHMLSAASSQLFHIGCVDTMRIGMDYGEGRQLQPRFKSYPATYVINGSFGSAGSPQENCLQNTAAYFFTHRRFFLNGQNMLTVDYPIPRNEAEFSTTLFGMTGSPVMFGDALDRMAEERLALLKKILPRPDDWPFAPDLFQRVYPKDYARTLAVQVQTAWDEWLVLAVFNLDNRPAATRIHFNDLRLPREMDFHVWDFWQTSYLGQMRKEFEIDVMPRACRLLRLTRIRPYPFVLSTDMHIRQGQFDLQNVIWNKQRMELTGIAIRPHGEKGNLYVIAPPGWKPANYRGLFAAKDAPTGMLIIRQPLDFSNRGKITWRIPFERHTIASTGKK